MAGGAGPLSVAATGLSAASSIVSSQAKGENDLLSGLSAANSGLAGAMRTQEMSELTDLKATQTDNILRQRLQGTLGNIQAVAASANVAGNSPTTEAIYNRTQTVGMQADYTQMSNAHLQSEMERDSAQLQLIGAMGSLQQGYANQQTDELNGILGAGGTVLKGLSGMSFFSGG